MGADQEELKESSPTFGRDGSFHIKEAVGSASISPSGRDVVLASPEGLHIIDLDNPWAPPRNIPHRQRWLVADVQWSPFATCDYRIASTSNQQALVWNLNMQINKAPIEHVLHQEGHTRAITDINFSAHDPEMLATCAIDSFIHCWDLRTPKRPSITFADWYASASQIKFNRQDKNILASSHDRCLKIWDTRKGSEPVKTIDAHATKIYGIDWNRTSPSRILTCSLDKTIKLWDLHDNDPRDRPMRVIRTFYPVWRARHTPFGSGILAMPQRGSNALHLYDRRLRADDKQDEIVEPVHVFEGHQDSVKEFLWRSQGQVENNVDDRSFQLVSWGTDNHLLLHRVDDATLKGVGYRRGQEAAKRISFTRKGAKYSTFHELSSHSPESNKAHGLSNLFKNAGQSGNKGPAISIAGLRSSYAQLSASGLHGTSDERQNNNPIDWMKGVKIGDSISDSQQLPALRSSDAPPLESLGDEITQAGKKFRKRQVSFEQVDILKRNATFTMTTHLGFNDSLAHLRASLKFPKDYPESSPPEIAIEKTSSISDATMVRLRLEIRTICDAYLDIGRGSLDPLISYLLGDQDLDATIAWVNRIHNAMQASLERLDSGSSSDDERDLIGQQPSPFAQHDLDLSGEEAVPVNANVNVPLPKACGAVWAPDGRLVCFFPPKEEASLLLGSSVLGSAHGHYQQKSGMEGLGWLDAALGPKGRKGSGSSYASTNSADDLSMSSTSDAESASDEADSIWPSTDFQHGVLSTIKSVSQLSIAPAYTKRKADASSQTVSLQNHDDLIPSKRFLASNYQIWGDDNSAVCTHNAEVASRHGLEDLAAVWNLVSLLVKNEVPLQVVPHAYEEVDILVVARRAVVQIRRNDGGLDLAFDEPDAVAHPMFVAPVQWGQHALGSGWLVRVLLEHYEDEGDIQMLAMLSCIFSSQHYAHESGHQTSRAVWHRHPREPHTKLSTLYYELEETAVSEAMLLDPRIDDQETIVVAGHSSSFGEESVWQSDDTEADRKSSNSSGLSPPLMSRESSHYSTSGPSLSTSPEEMRRSQSMLSTRIAASFSRPFSFMTSSSASPPSQPPTPELSTSAPSGVGAKLQFSKHDTVNLPRLDSRSGLAYELDVGALSDTDSDASDSDVEVRCTYKTTEHFDDELRIGFLHPLVEPACRAWREAYAQLLYAWQLPVARAELLKFNRASAMPGVQLGDSASTSKPIVLPARAGRRVYCTSCWEAVSGLHRSCLQCGHAVHVECLEALREDWDEELGCETGCGCSCQGAQMVEDASLFEVALSGSRETIGELGA